MLIFLICACRKTLLQQARLAQKLILEIFTKIFLQILILIKNTQQ